MNCDTGHLISLKENQEAPAGYTQVPNGLSSAAKRKLNGQPEATVSLTSGGKLSKWASEQRKNKRKTARASRKRNRK